MGKYELKEDTETTSKLELLWNIANELAEANRLKRLELIRNENVILNNPYSEKDDIIVAKLQLKELEDKA